VSDTGDERCEPDPTSTDSSQDYISPAYRFMFLKTPAALDSATKNTRREILGDDTALSNRNKSLARGE